ncbi:hypothetical protein BDZ94DRAFT_1380973 [Collybia nuda]|uniref:Uncharacterized protein n=1 Tax=Collybia nuda TaxID=64659 RepID=A0A9P5XXS5_9AGAR|nr:hypothetical protein BDZ94DRAFT_1380973 [Collybia nuda]
MAIGISEGMEEIKVEWLTIAYLKFLYPIKQVNHRDLSDVGCPEKSHEYVSESGMCCLLVRARRPLRRLLTICNPLGCYACDNVEVEKWDPIPPKVVMANQNRPGPGRQPYRSVVFSSHFVDPPKYDTNQKPTIYGDPVVKEYKRTESSYPFQACSTWYILDFISLHKVLES